MRRVYVVGVGMTPFGVHLDKSHDDLTKASVEAALADAGGWDGSEIDFIAYGSVVQGAIANNHVVPGQFALRKMGIGGMPIVNVENACATSGTAFNLCYNYIRAGLADVGLAVGTEKLNTPEREARFKVFNQPADIGEAEAFLARFGSQLAVDPDAADQPRSPNILMESYAASARLHMRTFGTTQAQLAVVSAKNHVHSQFNRFAHYQTPMTPEAVLVAKSIVWPLTIPMCAPISDGSVAVLLCSEDALARFTAARPVRVLACILTSGSERAFDDHARNVTRRAAHQAYEEAGIGPQDLSLAEVHDASAFGEINETEALDLCPIGEGGAFAASGASSLGGRLPVNTSGGLESRGHPLAATGGAQIHELVRQLRHDAGKGQVEGARLGLAQNGGGFIGVEEAAACVTILERVG